MSTYAVVIDGVVTNKVLSDQALDENWVLDNLGMCIGDLFDGTSVSKPPESKIIPQVVTMRQARLALLDAGLLSYVEAAMAAADEAAKIEWEYAQEVNRNHSLVQSLKVSLSLTEEQLDNLFTTAASL